MGRTRKKDKHLPPCVYQRHGAYWLVRKGRWTRLGTTLQSVYVALAHVNALAGGMPALIDEAFPVITRHLTPSSRSQYRVAAKKLKAILSEFSPAQVRPVHVAQIRRALADTPNTANRCVGVLRLIFAYALEEQLVESNPCIGIKRLAEGERDRYITDAEFLAIQAQAAPPMQVIADLCYLTAQRISDVLAIKHSDITDEGIYFQPSKTRKTTAAKVLVRMTPDLKATIERAKGLHTSLRAFTLLHGRSGKPVSYRVVKDWWDAACKAAGVANAHLHDIRAKSLTDTDRQGGEAQKLAGHADRAMTERYIRLRQTAVVDGPNFEQPAKILDRR